MSKPASLPQKRFLLGRLAIWGAILAVLAGGVAALWPRVRVMQHLSEARSALRRGDGATALRAVETAVAIQPDSAETQFLLAVIKRRSSRLDEFALHLRRAAELGWPEEDIDRQELLATAQRGDIEAVKQQLLQAIESGSTDEEAEEIYEAFAKGYLCTYRISDASMCVDFWLQWRPDAVQARIMRACIREQTGKRDEAMDDYRAVLDVFPNHREARIRLAQSLMVRKRHDEALAEFQACLAVAPEEPDALLGAAQCLRRQGKTADARRYLESLLPVSASRYHRGMALAELGQILLSEGKPREAMEPLMQALAMIPGESVVYHGLGMASARLGNRQQADAYHARLRRVHERYVRMADITDSLSREPFNAELRCEAGAILMEMDLKKEGADWLLTALRCDPNHRKTHELLAQYYAEIGDRSRAAHHRLLAAQAPKPSPPAKAK